MGLARRGHEVMVLAPSITGKFRVERDKEGGFRVARLPSVKFPFYPDQISKVPEAVEIFGKKLPRLAYKNGLHVSFFPYDEIEKVLDKFEPDLIHDQTPGPVALATFRYAKKWGVPIVSTGHAYPDNLTGQMKLGLLKQPVDAAVRKYFASFLKRSEYATMPTRLAIKDLLPENRKKFRVRVEAISNGIDLSRFSPGKVDEAIYAKYDIPRGRPVVLYVGRVDPEKSLGVLVKAFAKVIVQVPEAVLVMVGDGSDKERLMEMVAEMGMDGAVRWTGRVVGDDLPMLYRVGDVFAITSETETQSIVIMEAEATGLPVVAVDAGAVRELVKGGRNGVLCQPGNVDGVARGIVKILKDTRLKKRFGRESLMMARRHDIHYTLDRIEGIYREVVGG
jgi:glycosyltransferase involved in cell wall biosynthesis